MVTRILCQYAETRLEASREAKVTRDILSTYYLKALAAREADLKGRDQLRALDDINSDFENERTAWYWAAECRNYDLIDKAAESIFLVCTW